jgi:hypothetical protein
MRFLARVVPHTLTLAKVVILFGVVAAVIPSLMELFWERLCEIGE